jgi:hypothetical protein
MNMEDYRNNINRGTVYQRGVYYPGIISTGEQYTRGESIILE